MVWKENLKKSSHLDASHKRILQRLAQLWETEEAEDSSISNSQHSASDRLLAVTGSIAGLVGQGRFLQQAIDYLKAQSFPELIRRYEDSIESSVRRLPTQEKKGNPAGLFRRGERRIASHASYIILTSPIQILVTNNPTTLVREREKSSFYYPSLSLKDKTIDRSKHTTIQYNTTQHKNFLFSTSSGGDFTTGGILLEVCYGIYK